MDAFKFGADLVAARRWSRKLDQAVLAAIAGFHGDLAGPHGPSFATHLRLLRSVVSNVWIIAGARSLIRGRVPETNRTSRVTLHIDSIGLRVDSKLVRP